MEKEKKNVKERMGRKFQITAIPGKKITFEGPICQK